jgi:uncharacterized protein YceK
MLLGGHIEVLILVVVVVVVVVMMVVLKGCGTHIYHRTQSHTAITPHHAPKLFCIRAATRVPG